VDYADLPIIDLGLLASGTPDAFNSLAKQARDAMTDHGFFYVVNHGYTTAQARNRLQIVNKILENNDKIGLDRTYIRHCRCTFFSSQRER